jgi:hypothetical protein
MIDRESALPHHFLEVSIAERIPKVPAHAEQNDFRLKMTPFERGGSVHDAGSSPFLE